MNMNTLAVAVGQAVPDAPAITVDGKNLDVKLSEDEVRNHLSSLACDYCREMLVRMASAGQTLYVSERPTAADLAAFTSSPSQLAHDANHDAWHAWNKQAKAVKQEIRAQENKVYAGLKNLGFRGEGLRLEAKKVLAKMPKIAIPRLPELLDSHPKVERPKPVKVVRPKARFRKEDDAKATYRAQSVERTLQLLDKVAEGKL